MLRKYLFRIKHSYIKALEYRSEVIGWVILSVVPNIILLLIWQSVYRDSPTLNGYELSMMLQYVLLGTLINGLTSTHFESYQAREIREGRIDHFMTKPLAYPTQVFLADIGGKLFYATLAVPLFLLSFYALSFFFPLGSLSITLPAFLQFLFLILCGYLIEFSFALFSVFLTFWFEGADGLEHFKWIIITVLSGWMVPLSFMPSWLQSIVQKLPFQYMYAVPISILQNRTTLRFQDIAYLAVFFVFMYLVLLFTWKKAVYQYSSGGG